MLLMICAAPVWGVCALATVVTSASRIAVEASLPMGRLLFNAGWHSSLIPTHTHPSSQHTLIPHPNTHSSLIPTHTHPSSQRGERCEVPVSLIDTNADVEESMSSSNSVIG